MGVGDVTRWREAAVCSAALLAGVRAQLAVSPAVTPSHRPPHDAPATPASPAVPPLEPSKVTRPSFCFVLFCLLLTAAFLISHTSITSTFSEYKLLNVRVTQFPFSCN